MPVAAALPFIGEAAGTIGGALIGSNAQDNAIAAQKWATQQQIQELQREYDLNRADMAPWRTTGASGLDALAKLYGLATTGANGQTIPGTGKPDMSGFFTSPDYNWRLSQGIAGLDAGAAATGSLDSGATRKAEVSYGQNLGSQEFGNYVSRLTDIAGLGRSSASETASANNPLAINIGGAYQNLGNNMSSYYLGQGNMYSNALGSLANIGSGLIQNNPQWFNGSSGTSWGGGPI